MHETCHEYDFSQATRTAHREREACHRRGEANLAYLQVVKIKPKQGDQAINLSPFWNDFLCMEVSSAEKRYM